MLGISEDSGDQFRKWIHEFFEMSITDPGIAERVIAEMSDFFRQEIARRRAVPGDDLVSYLVNARIGDRALEDNEMTGILRLLLFAGIDTTWSTLGSTIHHLATHPEQQRHLRAHPEGMELAREEFLRAFAPVAPARIVTTDTEVNGTRLSKGDMVLVSFPSANRDEHEFEESDEVVLDRSPNRHLAFGYGAHVCLGQHLAKMEMRILWEELLPRLKSVELAGEAKLSEASFVNGPKVLPIRYALA